MIKTELEQLFREKKADVLFHICNVFIIIMVSFAAHAVMTIYIIGKEESVPNPLMGWGLTLFIWRGMIVNEASMDGILAHLETMHKTPQQLVYFTYHVHLHLNIQRKKLFTDFFGSKIYKRINAPLGSGNSSSLIRFNLQKCSKKFCASSFSCVSLFKETISSKI